jgi:hypothetical protein
MATTKEPGIYVVSLSNEEPISSQAGDSRNEVGAISVNKNNIKVGKARNLAAREKSYQKTFGADIVRFHPIALTSEQDVAEKVILRKLGPYRATNPSTGARVEWLENVTEAEAITMAVRALQDDGNIRYTLTSFAVMNSAGATEPIVVDKPAKQPDLSHIYRIGRPPGSLSEHNAKTWALLEEALAGCNGAASHDRLVEAANGHTDSAGRPGSAAAFVAYCVKNGWLVGAEHSQQTARALP